MKSESGGHDRLTRVIRWTARAWAVTAIGIVLLLGVGEGLYPASPAEWVGFLLYPGGICAGMVLAWWKEGLGGSITIGSLLAFYVLHTATAGSLPHGWAWLVLAAPGFFFLWSWQRSRRPSVMAV
jgi:hypothetical protein